MRERKKRKKRGYTTNNKEYGYLIYSRDQFPVTLTKTHPCKSAQTRMIKIKKIFFSILSLIDIIIIIIFYRQTTTNSYEVGIQNMVSLISFLSDEL